MSKISSVQKQKGNVAKFIKRPKRKRIKRKVHTKLSEFFRTSPLAGIDLSRDNSA